MTVAVILRQVTQLARHMSCHEKVARRTMRALRVRKGRLYHVLRAVATATGSELVPAKAQAIGNTAHAERVWPDECFVLPAECRTGQAVRDVCGPPRLLAIMMQERMPVRSTLHSAVGAQAVTS